jgi:subtilase family serine protease
VNAPKLVVPLLATLAFAACNAGGTSNLPGTPGQATSQRHIDPQAQTLVTRVCPNMGPGFAQCDALLINNGKVQPDEPGWQPLDFQTRYKLPITKGSGQIVAIVDAYDNPNAATDIATYRTEYGLGTANFVKYNQTGQQSNYPAANKNWGLEEDLDIEMVSASCPKCTIYLVEANSNGTSDLDTAEAEAVTLGAHVVSNSWGGGSVVSSYFDKPGVMYLASAGDDGYGTQAPADLATVVAVGGTVMSKTGSGVYSETTWRGTGSGCATGVTKPAWQHDTGCSSRTMNDVSAIAFQVSEYDSYGYGGWFTVGGTSVSSPLVGGVFGLAGNASKLDAGKKFWSLKKKARKKDLNDITTGTNGSCGGSYLCTAGPGYDGPTGWGTPKGIGAF